MAENVKSLPLSGEEIRTALLHKIEHSLTHTCNLRDGDAYGAFTAEISIRLRLDDFGRQVQDNHLVTMTQGQVPDGADEVTATFNIPVAPPNQVRMDTDQGVPVETIEKGKKVLHRVKVKKPKGRQ